MDDLPPPDSIDVNGELLVSAYCQGLFPMADDASGDIHWFRPDPRGIIPLEEFRVSRSLARRVRSGRFEISVDRCFERVIRECTRARSDDNGSWMTEQLLQAYCELHAHGLAHSLEAWRSGQLVGGVYGVHLGSAFFGESMFSRPDIGGTDASKVCLVHLVERLIFSGFTLLDTQYLNDHLLQFGCREVSAGVYHELLRAALNHPVKF
ncbi:MAG: leucyl/phenylalanyl-tRNA--protein transferase [Planctomycetes bacterium TMED75]|nr:leucyl/phenylalanyl-tRNA--protein transferase [Planctomycetaceae bacterium]OUU95098.1 MAG: leucyl/phenylalanyl-tRNA--protein transferase [Planctomycetes bacterium TMED75]